MEDLLILPNRMKKWPSRLPKYDNIRDSIILRRNTHTIHSRQPPKMSKFGHLSSQKRNSIVEKLLGQLKGWDTCSGPISCHSTKLPCKC